MLKELKEKVYEANMALPQYGLVTFTWGNASEIDANRELVVIKPSGVDYALLKPEDMVVLDLEGNIIEGVMRPSSDTPTHIALYKAWEDIAGIVHTHSRWATAWAQACLSIPCLGTTHADYFHGSIPCARALSPEEIKEAYEMNTGKSIIEEFMRMELVPSHTPAVLCSHHGPFTFGASAMKAVEASVVLEEVANMAYHTKKLNPTIKHIPLEISEKHYTRKHGENAYYGQ